MPCTIDRINAILRKLGGAEVTPAFFYATSPERMNPGHLILDAIDKRVGIITRYRYPTTYYAETKIPKGFRTECAPVGDRVRRLERHVFKEEAPPFFWLGAEAGAHG